MSMYGFSFRLGRLPSTDSEIILKYLIILDTGRIYYCTGIGPSASLWGKRAQRNAELHPCLRKISTKYTPGEKHALGMYEGVSKCSRTKS
jgi:hypothetical protein